MGEEVDGVGTCPLLRRSCEAECCEWWNVDTDKCAILLIAEALASFEEE